ncbi:MAG: hypothetical protein WBP81_11220 [Solirubrobacteraceae bacterium]
MSDADLPSRVLRCPDPHLSVRVHGLSEAAYARIVDGTVVSALIEFEDGYRAVTSRNGLRRAL